MISYKIVWVNMYIVSKNYVRDGAQNTKRKKLSIGIIVMTAIWYIHQARATPTSTPIRQMSFPLPNPFQKCYNPNLRRNMRRCFVRKRSIRDKRNWKQKNERQGARTVVGRGDAIALGEKRGFLLFLCPISKCEQMLNAPVLHETTL